METQAVFTVQTYKFQQQTVVCCIHVMPRRLKYFHRQDQLHVEYHWLQPEQRAAFENALEQQLQKLLTNGKCMDMDVIEFNCWPMLKVILKQCNETEEVKNGFCNLLGIRKNDVQLFLQCYIEHDAKQKDNVNKQLTMTQEAQHEEEYEPPFITEDAKENITKLLANVPSYTPTKKSIASATADECYAPQNMAVADNTSFSSAEKEKHKSRSKDRTKQKNTKKSKTTHDKQQLSKLNNNNILTLLPIAITEDDDNSYKPEPIRGSATIINQIDAPVYRPAPIISKVNENSSKCKSEVNEKTSLKRSLQLHANDKNHCEVVAKHNRLLGKIEKCKNNETEKPISSSHDHHEDKPSFIQNTVITTKVQAKQKPSPSLDYLKNTKETGHKSKRSKSKKIQELFGTDEEEEASEK